MPFRHHFAALGVAVGLTFASSALFGALSIPVSSDHDYQGSARILNVPQVSGLDGAAAGALLVRAGDGVAGAGAALTARGGAGAGANNVGGDLIGVGGASVGSGAGSSVDLAPGAVVTGARGRVFLHHGGPNLDRVLELSSTGANGAAVSTFVTAVTPEGVITGSPGDLARFDNGTTGNLFLKATGVATTAGWVTFPVAATPLSVTATGTTSITTSEAVLLSGNITLPAGGRVFAAVGLNISLSTPILLASNGASVRLRVAGTDVTNSARTIQQSSAIAVTLTTDSQEVSSTGIGTCPINVACLVEALVVKVGTNGTTSAVGQRRLDVFRID